MTTENYDMWLIEHWRQRALKAEAALAAQSPAPQEEAAEPVAKPFGWYGESRFDNDFTTNEDTSQRWRANGYRLTPLYTTPPLPQRQEAAQVEATRMAGRVAAKLDAMARAYAKGHQWDALDAEVCTEAAAMLRALATPPASSRVAAPTMQAVKVPLTPEQIKRELDAAKVPDSEDDAYDFQVWRACERFYGIHPTEGERSHD